MWASVALLATLAASAVSADEPLPRGLLVPQREAWLSSLMEGQIEAIHKQEGELFQKNELLISFVCTVRQAKLHQTQATLLAARKKMQANRELVAVRAASRLELALNEAEVMQAEAELAVQKALVEMCSIRAPFAGRVHALSVHAHESVPQGKPLLDISSSGPFEVRVIVPSRYHAALPVGSSFSIFLEETRQSYPLQVIRSGGRIDPVSQTMPIVGRIQGEFQELLPGMGGPVTLPNWHRSSPAPAP
ncbi:efflux RND transporter periplasmic adaptor subunit [Candidatus Magnetaquicoccus inordinatus]|uniref:efflux RND transporter periplasmic adaptor subunit n=1 Tax=Candidatus Magnetaquicoccus inordinatus TaxID=2496818 RepID=UPI00187D2D3A|nr:HlyD family efflux transporter periplasmic adaptor subunit [Candidatus Magnetaquicoccus inordinatus]